MTTQAKAKAAAVQPVFEEPEIPIIQFPMTSEAEEVDPNFQLSEEEKPSTSALSLPVDDLVSVLRSINKPKVEGGKLREPDPFTGKDLKKLKTFIFQCTLYFQGSAEFDDN